MKFVTVGLGICERSIALDFKMQSHSRMIIGVNKYGFVYMSIFTRDYREKKKLN
jgi:hypothetical protein